LAALSLPSAPEVSLVFLEVLTWSVPTPRSFQLLSEEVKSRAYSLARHEKVDSSSSSPVSTIILVSFIYFFFFLLFLSFCNSKLT
jgi:hypothetical protein